MPGPFPKLEETGLRIESNYKVYCWCIELTAPTFIADIRQGQPAQLCVTSVFHLGLHPFFFVSLEAPLWLLSSQ